jgi:hypothetical protein
LTVSGKSTAWTTNHGTPEASSCDSQKAGPPAPPQPTTVEEEEESGEEESTVGRVRLMA